MSRFRLAKRVESDLDEIWSYIAADSVTAADRAIDRIYELIQMLARQPLIGQSRNDLRSELREFPAKSYVIYYRPLDDGVEVVRIIHSARDVAGMF